MAARYLRARRVASREIARVSIGARRETIFFSLYAPSPLRDSIKLLVGGGRAEKRKKGRTLANGTATRKEVSRLSKQRGDLIWSDS